VRAIDPSPALSVHRAGRDGIVGGSAKIADRVAVDAVTAWVFHCLLDLLSVAGLRISEALELKLGDVDLEQGVLTIRAAKFGRSRLVPLHPTTCTVLAQYLQRRNQFLGATPASDSVFVSNRRTRLDTGRVSSNFLRAVTANGLEGARSAQRPSAA
jgi:integrase/recombinase XerD